MDTRMLLWREELVKLGGAALRGRYGGGGGSTRLSLSVEETGRAGGTLFAEFIEIASEVSMPVKYAPFAPDGTGP